MRMKRLSSRTKCNFCTLTHARRQAEVDGVEITLGEAELKEGGRMWISLQRSDEKEPSHFFLELSDHCVC